MAKHSDLIIIGLREIFEKETDENNYLGIKELNLKLTEYMDKKHSELYPDGFEITNKSIKKYIKHIDNSGFTIEGNIDEKHKRGRKIYYHEEKFFEQDELLIIINALNNAKFLSDGDTKSVKKKIRSISSKNVFDRFEEFINTNGKYKVNKTKKYNISNIAHALIHEECITMKYSEYVIEDKKIRKKLKHGGRNYHIEPYGAVLNSGKLYLVGKDIDTQTVKNFRLDMIENINYMKKKMNKNGFDINEYVKDSVSMYKGGELIDLELKVQESAICNVKDYFGRRLNIIKYSKDYIVIRQRVFLNQGLISVLMRFGNRVEILNPKIAREKMKKAAEKIEALYNGNK